MGDADCEDDSGRRLRRPGSRQPCRAVGAKRQRILLRNINYDVVADPKLPIAQAVEAANNDAILMAFPIAAFGQGRIGSHRSDAPVHVPMCSSSARGSDSTPRPWMPRVRTSNVSRAYPENIEAEASHTYTRPLRLPDAAAGAGRIRSALACVPAARPWSCTTAW